MISGVSNRVGNEDDFQETSEHYHLAILTEDNPETIFNVIFKQTEEDQKHTERNQRKNG